ncbi:sensor histidine kinase [Gryllotalpicola reticulitermitis]|uniref:histidine kinase n=1 Tax=Gryllotalpicola reticulitermitis TaxID=1184153 RepID=A0ABV8QB26_9MICO
MKRSVGTETKRDAVGEWWTPRFGDDLIRPFVLVGVSAIAITQLVLDPPRSFAPLVWSLTVAVVVIALSTLLPWTSFPESARVTLVTAFAVLAGALFPFPPAGASVVLVFIASSTAGEKLATRQAALTVAATGAAVATVATWLLSVTGVLGYQSQWWLSLAVVLPVYIGISRRDRGMALRAAEYAVAQRERASASEAREAALEERGRIAREIHDVLGHSLSGIAMQLDMADALHDSDRDVEANEAVKRARGLAVSGIAETRRAIQAVREDTLPLPRTLQNLADGAGADLRVTGDPLPVGVEVAQTVIRAAQEAITNALKYAPGGRIDISLDYTNDALIRLTVTDSGAPPDALHREPQSGGMGLVGMRERAALLGGTANAGPSSHDGAGWIVTVELPR